MIPPQFLTEKGNRLEGAFENDRNSRNRETFKAIIREVYGVADMICAHHLVYVIDEVRKDGFSYEIPQEIPSADTLIFDHDVAKKIWGYAWRNRLAQLALEPVATRDDLLTNLYNNR